MDGGTHMQIARHTDSFLGHIERYRMTAQAIGLLKLLGNGYPSTKQVKLAEEIITKLKLTWEACEDADELRQELRN